MSRGQLLRTIPLFEGLLPDDLDHLVQSLVERRLAAGASVFQQGDAGNAMYIVVDGRVNIHLPMEGSKRVSLKDIDRGEYFGELALFDDKPRSASAVVTTDATLLELGRETLSAYLTRRPRAVMPILRTMADRLRETNAMLSERATKNAVEEYEKNLSWSDRLADRVAELNGSWALILVLVGLTAAWALVNAPFFVHRVDILKARTADGAPLGFDPYPYVFYNLVLTILVALQGPLIVMSQNRQATKDRAQAEGDFKVNLKNEINIETIMRELSEFRVEARGRISQLERVDWRGRRDVTEPAR